MGSLCAPFSDGLSRHGSVSVTGAAELDGRYLSIFSRQHPEASTFLGSVANYAPEELSSPSSVGSVSLFIAGIPCTGASKSGISKNKLACAELHKDVGALFLPFLHRVTLAKPDVIVCENVPPYANTFSTKAIRSHLTRIGYEISEQIVNPYTDFATATERKRWIMVASRIGAFKWDYTPESFTGTIESLIDPASAADAEDEFSHEQVAAHTRYIDRKASEGCGFARRILERTSTKVPTICKTYHKQQPSSTFLRSGETYRMLRPREVARIHGFGPEFIEIIESLPKTTAYEVLGQGVVAKPFFALGEAIGSWVSAKQQPRAAA